MSPWVPSYPFQHLSPHKLCPFQLHQGDTDRINTLRDSQRLAMAQFCCFIQNSQGLGPSCPKGLCCTVLSYRALAEPFNLIFWRGKGTGYIHCTADLSENPGWLCPCFTPFPSHFSKASPSAGPALILCLLPHFFRLIPLFCTAPSRAEQHRTAPAEPGVTHRLFAALHRVLGTAAHLSQHLWACGIKGMWA